MRDFCCVHVVDYRHGSTEKDGVFYAGGWSTIMPYLVLGHSPISSVIPCIRGNRIVPVLRVSEIHFEVTPDSFHGRIEVSKFHFGKLIVDH